MIGTPQDVRIAELGRLLSIPAANPLYCTKLPEFGPDTITGPPKPVSGHILRGTG